jgi:hypothetical protein
MKTIVTSAVMFMACKRTLKIPASNARVLGYILPTALRAMD